jgi:hypothetical protein
VDAIHIIVPGKLEHRSVAIHPSTYFARYFGHKLHYDQNEKLVHCGVTYVMARDGFSGKIIKGAMMPLKNNNYVSFCCSRVWTLGSNKS